MEGVRHDLPPTGHSQEACGDSTTRTSATDMTITSSKKSLAVQNKGVNAPEREDPTGEGEALCAYPPAVPVFGAMPSTDEPVPTDGGAVKLEPFVFGSNATDENESGNQAPASFTFEKSPNSKLRPHASPYPRREGSASFNMQPSDSPAPNSSFAEEEYARDSLAYRSEAKVVSAPSTSVWSKQSSSADANCLEILLKAAESPPLSEVSPSDSSCPAELNSKPPKRQKLPSESQKKALCFLSAPSRLKLSSRNKLAITASTNGQKLLPASSSAVSALQFTKPDKAVTKDENGGEALASSAIEKNPEQKSRSHCEMRPRPSSQHPIPCDSMTSGPDSNNTLENTSEKEEMTSKKVLKTTVDISDEINSVCNFQKRTKSVALWQQANAAQLTETSIDESFNRQRVLERTWKRKSKEDGEQEHCPELPGLQLSDIPPMPIHSEAQEPSQPPMNTFSFTGLLQSIEEAHVKQNEMLTQHIALPSVTVPQIASQKNHTPPPSMPLRLDPSFTDKDNTFYDPFWTLGDVAEQMAINFRSANEYMAERCDPQRTHAPIYKFHAIAQIEVMVRDLRWAAQFLSLGKPGWDLATLPHMFFDDVRALSQSLRQYLEQMDGKKRMSVLFDGLVELDRVEKALHTLQRRRWDLELGDRGRWEVERIEGAIQAMNAEILGEGGEVVVKQTEEASDNEEVQGALILGQGAVVSEGAKSDDES